VFFSVFTTGMQCGGCMTTHSSVTGKQVTHKMLLESKRGSQGWMIFWSTAPMNIFVAMVVTSSKA